jgi:hypothetical protein
MTVSNEYTCPACGFLVFDAPPGTYDICPICHWEDDHVQLRYPNLAGGANAKSLLECQQETLIKYPADVHEVKGYRRDPRWRPLAAQDLEAHGAGPTDGTAYFLAACQTSPGYYWLE